MYTINYMQYAMEKRFANPYKKQIKAYLSDKKNVRGYIFNVRKRKFCA